MSIILVLASLCAAWGVIGLMPITLRKSEMIGMCAVLSVLLGAWLSLVCILLLGYEAGMWAAVVIMTGFAGYARTRTPQVEELVDELTRWRWIYNGILVVLGLYLFSLAYNHFFLNSGGGWWSVGYTWADLALHSTLASHFAQEAKFDFSFPILQGTQISYPFLVDFWSGLLLRGGWGHQAAFLVPSILLLGAFVRLYTGFVERVAGMRAAVISLLGVLLSGSAAATWYFAKDWLSGSARLVEAYDYSMADTEVLHMANLVTSHLLPQRSFLLGMCAVLVILIVLHAWTQRATARLLFAASILTGLLPFVHVHSFGVAGLLLLGTSLYMLATRKASLGIVVAGAALCLVLALPQLAWQADHSFQGNFIAVHGGWMTPQGQSVLVFWLRNFGLIALSMPALPWLLRRKSPLLYVTSIIAVSLFILANLFRFQPNIWDNMKFFSYSYCLLLIPVSAWLASLSRRWQTAGVTAVGMALLFAPGMIALNRESHVEYEFLSDDDKALAAYVTEHIPNDAVILTSDRHNHPIPVLTGRPIVMGYPGWLWSYGIAYQPWESDVKSMFRGAPQVESLFNTYHVDYVVIGADEVTKYDFNRTYYTVSQEYLTTIGEWEVYKVRR